MALPNLYSQNVHCYTYCTALVQVILILLKFVLVCRLLTMLTRPEVLLPITNTPTGCQHPSQKFISPSTSRHIGLRSPVTLLNSVHDDEKERKERRRSRVLDLQRKNVASPNSPSDRYCHCSYFIFMLFILRSVLQQLP